MVALPEPGCSMLFDIARFRVGAAIEASVDGVVETV
jgi:hypothetical protein